MAEKKRKPGLCSVFSPCVMGLCTRLIGLRNPLRFYVCNLVVNTTVYDLAVTFSELKNINSYYPL